MGAGLLHTSPHGACLIVTSPCKRRLARKAESARQARLRHKQFVTDLQEQAAGLQARIRELEVHCTTGPGSATVALRELKEALKPEQMEQLQSWCVADLPLCRVWLTHRGLAVSCCPTALCAPQHPSITVILCAPGSWRHKATTMCSPDMRGERRSLQRRLLHLCPLRKRLLLLGAVPCTGEVVPPIQPHRWNLTRTLEPFPCHGQRFLPTHTQSGTDRA